ncbi:ABC transporter permease [Halobacillus massiliensis]|uniref:ABC transporter permease n=1 Tax=Halobacillus massiliensis TaxID=1926286 RepID=UPI0009E433FB|nr:ABC transporter permease [Halobacillus massiliensis]
MVRSLLASEWLKIKRTKVWSLLFISPLFAAIIGFTVDLPVEGKEGWAYLLVMMGAAHSLLILPLIISVFSGFICRYEHQSGGWRRLFSMPVARQHVYLAKYLIVFGLVALNQLMFSIVYITAGLYQGIGGGLPVDILFKCLIGGLIATMPLIALTLWFAAIWSSFAAPFTLNVILTIPNMLVANSEMFRPWYPWVQPFIMMQAEDGGFFTMPAGSLLLAVGLSFVLLYIGGSVSIQRKAV